jgi:hypothetical protein
MEQKMRKNPVLLDLNWSFNMNSLRKKKKRYSQILATLKAPICNGKK